MGKEKGRNVETLSLILIVLLFSLDIEKLTTKVSIFYIFINRGRCRFSLVLMHKLFTFVDEWVQNHDILLFWQARPVVHVFQVKSGARV